MKQFEAILSDLNFQKWGNKHDKWLEALARLLKLKNITWKKRCGEFFGPRKTVILGAKNNNWRKKLTPVICSFMETQYILLLLDFHVFTIQTFIQHFYNTKNTWFKKGITRIVSKSFLFDYIKNYYFNVYFHIIHGYLRVDELLWISCPRCAVDSFLDKKILY